MARSTAQISAVWVPRCTSPWARVELHGDGVVYVRPGIVQAVLALNEVLRRFDYKTRREVTGAFNCRLLTGSNVVWSLHAYGVSLDINWDTNPYGPKLVTDMPRSMVQAIKAIRTYGGHEVWRWGGDFGSNKDAMHFEIVASPAELARGIDPRTLPQEVQVVLPAGFIHRIDSMVDDGQGTLYVAGWVIDTARPGDSVAIDFHAWDAGHGPQITSLQADLDSPDVNEAMKVEGRHRFAGTVSLPRVRRDPTIILWGKGLFGAAPAKLEERVVSVMR